MVSWVCPMWGQWTVSQGSDHLKIVEFSASPGPSTNGAWIDAGAGGRSVLVKGARPMVLSMENPILASSKTVVLTASGGDQISSTYKGKGHGLMTYFFLKGLQGEGERSLPKVCQIMKMRYCLE